MGLEKPMGSLSWIRMKHCLKFTPTHSRNFCLHLVSEVLRMLFCLQKKLHHSCIDCESSPTPFRRNITFTGLSLVLQFDLSTWSNLLERLMKLLFVCENNLLPFISIPCRLLNAPSARRRLCFIVKKTAAYVVRFGVHWTLQCVQRTPIIEHAMHCAVQTDTRRNYQPHDTVHIHESAAARHRVSPMCRQSPIDCH